MIRDGDLEYHRRLEDRAIQQDALYSFLHIICTTLHSGAGIQFGDGMNALLRLVKLSYEAGRRARK